MGGTQDPWEMGLHCLAPAQAAPTAPVPQPLFSQGPVYSMFLTDALGKRAPPLPADFYTLTRAHILTYMQPLNSTLTCAHTLMYTHTQPLTAH